MKHVSDRNVLLSKAKNFVKYLSYCFNCVIEKQLFVKTKKRCTAVNFKNECKETIRFVKIKVRLWIYNLFYLQSPKSNWFWLQAAW